MSDRLKRILQVLVIASVPLLLFAVNQLLARQFADVRILAEELEQSHRAREQLKTILSLHQDIETGYRGYVLTGDAAFLEPYAGAQQGLDAEFGRLDALTGGKTDLRAPMAEMRRLSAEKRAFASEVVRLTGQGRQQDAVRLIASLRGKVIMDAMRVQIAEASTRIARDVEATGARRTVARVQTQRVAYTLQTLLVLLLLVAAWVVLRSLRAQRRAARRFQDLNARQEAIFDGATDGLVVHDGEGTIESINPAMSRMHGYAPGELTGGHIDLFFKNPIPREQMRAYLRMLIKSPAGSPDRTREVIGCRKDGSEFPADVVISPVFLADRTLFLAAVRDASERKRVEQMKNEFVSTVSHELRTPLTSIAGSLGLLGGGAAGPLPEKAARLIKIAHNNSERLVRLVNDILDIEKMESGRMAFHLTWVRLVPLLEQAVLANRGFASRYAVTLELGFVPADAAVTADEDRLMQVITNLLSNAVKFSPTGETVRISVTVLGDWYRITVSDRGPGISEAFRERIFDKFAQADASDARSKSGTGLGLSIAREIVTRLGGTLSFDSEPGKGSAFHIDLPAAGHAAAQPGA